MKLLHTGDMHLDSPFAGLDIATAERRRREMRDTLSAMVRYVRENDLDMLIISGDLFDGAFITRETVSLLVREFSSLSCPVIITTGNHDHAGEDNIWEKTEFSKNVHVFKKPSLEKISFDSLGCDVYGYGFNSQYLTECPVTGTVEDPDRINILVCHGDTASPISKYAPLPLSALRAFGADYTALGHIHTPDAQNGALLGIGAYCGCPEGRDFGECGEKGALLVNVEKGKYEIEKIPFAKRIYEVRELSVEGLSDMGDVCLAVERFISQQGFGEKHLLRTVLTGGVSPSLVINTKVISENRYGVYFLDVEDCTTPTFNNEELLSDNGIRGEVYRTLLPSLESADKEERESAALSLRYALAALAGQDITDF